MEGGREQGCKTQNSRNSDAAPTNSSTSDSSTSKSTICKWSEETVLNPSKFDRGDENWPESVRDFILNRDNSFETVDCHTVVEIIIKTLCHFKNGCTQQEIIRSIHMQLEPVDTVHILNALDFAVSKGQLQMQEGRYLPMKGRIAAPAPSRRPSSPIRKKPKHLMAHKKSSKMTDK